MSDARPQYLADGFTPTVEDVTLTGGRLVMRTTDARDETDIVSTEDGLVRRRDLATEDGQDALDLHNE